MLRSGALKVAITLVIASAFSSGAQAQKNYDSGASDTEIKFGQTMPYSGPASAYGTQGKAEAAYWKMINAQGGVNGRKINFMSLDDGYSPPKTVEQTRKLVEEEGILANIGSLGTPTNSAIQKYLNAKKMPHIFISTGASKWNDPKAFPYTVPFYPPYLQEAKIYGKNIAETTPNAKIAVLFQNDDFGKDYLKGLKEGLGAKASLIVKEVSFEVTDPTIDSQLIALQSSGADTFIDITTPKFAAQAIRKMHELQWKPMHVLTDVSTSIGSVIKPAGFEAAEGIVSAQYRKDASDAQWKDDPGMKNFMTFIDKYMPGADVSDANLIYGYNAAQTMIYVLERCGDDLTRANIMKQAADIDSFMPEVLLPGIRTKTSPADFAPIEQLQMMKFAGGKWVLFGDVLSAETER